VVLLALGFTLLIGCDKKGSEDLNLVPVSGKVTVGKTPLPLGSVMYYPDSGKGNNGKRVPQGQIQPDGTYKLSTSSEAGVQEGAPPGWYRVAVTPTGASETNQTKARIPTYNLDYTFEKNTKLVVEVKPGGGNYDLVLTP